jgi:arginine repressor
MALGTIVLGGVVAGPAVLVSGFFVAAQAEKVKTEVRRHIAKMDVAKAEMSRQITEFRAIKARADEMELGILRLAVQVEEVLQTADVMSEEDVYRVARLAKALADAVKVPAMSEVR